MAAVTDEEGGRGARTTRLGTRHVLAHARGVDTLLELTREALDIQVELSRVAEEVLRLQLVLMPEEDVVVLPEASLGGGRLGRLGSQLGVGVRVR